MALRQEIPMPSPELVWIIDDDQSIRWVLDKALAQADLHTCVFDSAEATLAKLAKAAVAPQPRLY